MPRIVRKPRGARYLDAQRVSRTRRRDRVGSKQYLTEDRSPFAQRWGGWYVTGSTGSMPHMGNSVVNKTGKLQPMLTGKDSKPGIVPRADRSAAYLSPYSDVVALMVFEHQMHMMNLFTRVGWDVRRSLYRDEMNPEKGDAATAETLFARVPAN